MISQTWPEAKLGIRPNLSWNETSSHFLFLFALGARATVLREEAIFGFPIVQAKERERSREEIEVWITGMEYLYGIHVWITRMDYWYGILVWSSCMEIM